MEVATHLFPICHGRATLSLISSAYGFACGSIFLSFFILQETSGGSHYERFGLNTDFALHQQVFSDRKEFANGRSSGSSSVSHGIRMRCLRWTWPLSHIS